MLAQERSQIDSWTISWYLIFVSISQPSLLGCTYTCCCFWLWALACVSYVYICRWHRKLLLWTGASNETTSYPDDSQPPLELWIVQENGNLCMFLATKSIVFCTVVTENDMLIKYEVVVFLFLPKFSSKYFVLCLRDHTKPQQRRWQNITVMTTSSSSDPSGQTTCQSSASRCSAVSRWWTPSTGFSLGLQLTFSDYFIVDYISEFKYRQKKITFSAFKETLYCFVWQTLQRSDVFIIYSGRKQRKVLEIIS